MGKVNGGKVEGGKKTTEKGRKGKKSGKEIQMEKSTVKMLKKT